MTVEDTIDDDLWDAALDPFANDPAAAFIFAQVLFSLKQKIESGPEGALWTVKALDDAIVKVYPYTHTYQAAFKLYLLAVEGKLLPKHDPTVTVKEI